MVNIGSVGYTFDGIVSCRYLGQFSDMTKVISEKRWWISVSADDLKEVIQEILTLLPSRISQAKKTIFELEEDALCIRTAQNIGTIKARVPCAFKDEDIPEEYINAYLVVVAPPCYHLGQCQCHGRHRGYSAR